MAEPVYVAAIWSIAHASWAEFVVSPDAGKVRQVCALLAEFTATHIRIVRVERDDWELIRPALARLGPPPKSYTPREVEVLCDERREFAAAVVGSDEPRSGDLAKAVPFERRRVGRLV